MNIEAKKRFGQNFLKDEAILEKIIQSMPKTSNHIVEIGPGLGDLTKNLLKIKDVTAFEIDRDLCRHLRKSFQEPLQKGRLKLICADVLEHWKSKELVHQKYDLVANLPYYVATNIILKALKDPNCQNILVMLQKEVAQKFSALPGQKEFGSLSVIADSVGEAQMLFTVPPQAFVPPPKVESAILYIKKDKNLDDERFLDFLKAAFRQPRKKLLKNLSSLYEKKELENIFEELGLSSNIRPHEAATSIYHQLYKRLEERKIDGTTNKRESSNPK